MKWILCLIALCAFTASAADVSGAWKASVDTPNGTVERAFVFKVDGHKLTGESTSNMFGKSTIEGGTVEGDRISFYMTVNVQGNEGKVTYTGKIVDADTIKFTVNIEASGQSFDLVAKRSS